MDFVNWKVGLSLTFYVLVGVEKFFGDITPDLTELGVPDSGIHIGSLFISNLIDTMSLIAVSVLGLSGLVRPAKAG